MKFQIGGNILMLKNKIKKHHLVAATIVGSILVSYAFPAMAQEVAWHDWSTATLIQGEKYGIYPLAWYDDMQVKMDSQDLETFCNAIGKKLEAISGISLKKDATALAYRESSQVTRGEVLEGIYAVLNQYTYPAVVDLGNDAIIYMQEKEIVKGTGKDLNLDKTCTLEEAAVFGTRIVKAFYEDLNAGSKGLLWKVQKDDNIVYMLGSVHLANYSIYPFNESILDAYASADVLGVELNFYSQEGIADYNQLAVYSDGTTLKDHISPDLYEEVIEAAQKLGMAESDISLYKPWCMANTFSSAAMSGSSSVEEKQVAALLGIDNYFMTDALVNDVPIYELEGYAYQAGLLDGFSPELQEYYLSNTVDMILDKDLGDESEEILANWLEYWEKGDLEDFEKTFTKKTTQEGVSEKEKALLDEYNNKLWTVRDAEMTDKIESLLNGEKGKTYFVVVGSGHYIGEDGVIQNLKNKGYTVEQVK